MAGPRGCAAPKTALRNSLGVLSSLVISVTLVVMS
jgi:hypothetical protein